MTSDSPATYGADARHGRWSTLVVLALVLFALWTGSRGLLDEDAVSTQGDMPRYLMNAVFLRDLVVSGEYLSWDGFVRFAQEYYARYPSLSLGHHPPLLPALIAPAFTVFGISVLAGRVVLVLTFVWATVAMYGVTLRLYNAQVAAWAAGLFVTHPLIISFGQQVMSEMLMLALVLTALWQLLLFADAGRTRHLAFFVVAAAMSLYARQLAITAFPAYAIILLSRVGWRRLFRRDALLLAGLLVLLVLPLVPVTLALSPLNVSIVLRESRPSALITYTRGLRLIYDAQLVPALWLGLSAGLLAGLVRLDRRLLIPAAWGILAIASVMALTGTIAADRYALVALPSFCVVAGSLAAIESGPWRKVALAALVATMAWQLVPAVKMRPAGASGYETAARWIIENTAAPTVIFSGPVDTGYFTFFMRKHDAHQRFVVLRADKLFATSMMGWHGMQQNIEAPEEIYPILQRLGTRFVVIEDLPSSSKALEWFRSELGTPRFVERLRLPQHSTDRRLLASSLVVYEYLDARPAAADAALDLNLPLIGRRIVVPLSALIAAP